MDIFGVVTFLGGLALFFYGMCLMEECLVKFAGGKLERMLERLTASPFQGVLVGTVMTALIQSSSAVTVMVVGLVDSGMMSLEQSVGIIMGANIGTTVTSWLLGAIGMESSSFLVRLLQPSTTSPLCALVGVGVLMTSKRQRLQNIATVFVGFSILMFGMDTMSRAVQPLAELPEFTGIMTRFSNPFMGVAGGTFVTALIQSSSAAVGILQALSITGGVTYSLAIPMIIGQNIGTCVTALLAGIGACRNAQRTALIHLYLNVLGAVIFMSGFYGLNSIVRFSFMEKAATPMGIAAIHSIFNVVVTVALFPFSGLLVRLVSLGKR